MTTDELLFFNSRPQALPLYAALSEKLLTVFPDVTVEVKKTQITFRARYGFAFVSLGRMRGSTPSSLILAIGLRRRLDSPRVAAASEPYPSRWTHHLVLHDASELDEELMGWLREAHDFALTK